MELGPRKHRIGEFYHSLGLWTLKKHIYSLCVFCIANNTKKMKLSAYTLVRTHSQIIIK